MKRRDFFKASLIAASSVSLTSSLNAASQPKDNQKISKVAFPEKRPMITYSDRPPLLESPRATFTKAITSNDEFFVRWHMPEIPTQIDTQTFKIKVSGLVEREFEISLHDLKTQYEQVEVTAALQCGGNSRSAFSPIAGGIQWGSGAMGCAKWKGVRLSDILERAGLKKDAYWIGFNGLETAAYYKTPNFIRELRIDELDNHVIIAYEMNDEDLPYLNGYPVRLVIPGTYSDSWVKMLSEIRVTKDYEKLFFMDIAYRVPDNETQSETPEKRYPRTKPIVKMNVKSVIGYPENKTIIQNASHVVVRGVAFDDGTGITDVLVSIDGGKTWEKSILDKGDAGRYAFRAFRYSFKPKEYGKLTIMSKAINRAGDEQPFAKDIGWNHGGYKYNGIDEVTVEVV
ncbi:MAG: sulfite:cytochrome C oxidoreductase subunit A [Sulfurimonas sp.]|nr:MAG: sulfite:cytochrome C oxidoreductase subunit A [Sulfurimonas sp.]